MTLGAQHAAAHARAHGQVGGLGVLAVGADVADVGEGEGDDLAGVGGIGQDLLVAGHGRVEADLAHGRAGGAEPLPGDHRAVGQHQPARQRGLRPGFGGSMCHRQSLVCVWPAARGSAAGSTRPCRRESRRGIHDVSNERNDSHARPAEAETKAALKAQQQAAPVGAAADQRRAAGARHRRQEPPIPDQEHRPPCCRR